MRFTCVRSIALVSSLITFGASAPTSEPRDITCKHTKYPNPVILLHPLFGNSRSFEDSGFAGYMDHLGFCTYSFTYGRPLGVIGPPIGGLKAISDSAAEIAHYIRVIKEDTGAEKVDIVGHSEGGFQAIYVPKFEDGISSIVDRIIAIAPPTHGTNLSGIYNYLEQNQIVKWVAKEVIKSVCEACTDIMYDGPAVRKIDDGDDIVQPGNNMTIIISLYDQVATIPEESSFVDGAHNIAVQNHCFHNRDGHLGLASDRYVWSLVANTLDPRIPVGKCTAGDPR